MATECGGLYFIFLSPLLQFFLILYFTYNTAVYGNINCTHHQPALFHVYTVYLSSEVYGLPAVTIAMME